MSEPYPASQRSEETASPTPTLTASADSPAAQFGVPANMPSTAYSGYRRGFFFWSLAPFLVLFLVVMAIVPEKNTPEKIVILCAVETAALSLLLGLWNPDRFWWAWRVLGAIVFLAYVAYVFAMAIEGRVGAGRRSEPSLINSVLGLIVFGLPGLWFAIFGRLTWSQESPDFDDGMFDEELDDGENTFDARLDDPPLDDNSPLPTTTHYLL